MDAETRRTLAAMVLSMLIRVSFVFLALRERENGASVQKTNEKMKGVGEGREKMRGEEKRRGKRRRKIISFLIL